MEIGYMIDDTYWGQGLTGEAAQCVIDYVVRHLCIRTIIGFHRAVNIQSRRVFDKMGFKSESQFNHTQIIKGESVKIIGMRWSSA